jgi:polyisoprenoid-binding protein YceI
MELTMKLLKHFAFVSVLAASVVASGLTSRIAFADDEPDSIVVLASHTEPKPVDPVKVEFKKFKVVKATFDPAKVVGGTATIEIDVTSLKTDSDKRDAHLQSPDFIDTSKFATITVDIGNVKKKAGKTYSADATVKFRDITKKYPVTFDVVDQKADSIRIKGEAKFSRVDFKVGKDSKDPKEAPVAAPLTIQMNLTLKKS